MDRCQRSATDLTRRQALQAGGALAFGALAAGMLGGCASTSASSTERTWDKEADVVVIGAGTGLYTALRTQKAGLKTIVLEKAEQAGGSTIYSSSVVWAPANDLMKQAGDADSREDALAYIEAGSGETYLPEHAAAFVDTVNTAISNIADMTH